MNAPHRRTMNDTHGEPFHMPVPANNMNDTRSESLRIPTPSGTIQVQCWEATQGHDAALAPIVLLHDSLGCIRLWRDFPERLAAASKRRVIAYDRPGFGQSDPHPGELVVPDFIADEARDTFAVIRRALGVGPFIVIGHSVGGCMGICIAAQHPAECIGLVTLAAQAIMEDYTRAGVREGQEIFSHPGHVQPLVQYHGDKARWVLDAWIGAWLSPAMEGWHLTTELQSLQCPTLVVQGERDEYCSMRQAEHIMQHAGAHASLLRLPKCGHSPHRERQAELMAALLPWLGGLR